MQLVGPPPWSLSSSSSSFSLSLTTTRCRFRAGPPAARLEAAAPPETAGLLFAAAAPPLPAKPAFSW